MTEAKKINGPCVCCNRHHTYERDFPFGKTKVPTRRLDSCQKFQGMTVQERGQLIEKLTGCYICLDPKHTGDCCRSRKVSCDVKVGLKPCDGGHNKLLHNSGIAYCHTTAATFSDSNVLFEIQELDLPEVNMSAVVLFDNSSSASMVTHEFAELAGLSGVMIKYMLKATGFPLQLKSTMLYKLKLEDRDGILHVIEALGIDEITDANCQINLKLMTSLFPDALQKFGSGQEAK